MQIGLICQNHEWRDPSVPHRAVRQGLQRLGHNVEVVVPAHGGGLFSAQPDAAFLWNAVHGVRGQIAAELRDAGATVFVMERGFFDRFRHTQIDGRGFNHTASWARGLGQPAPDEGAARLRASFGVRTSIRPRRDGHVLVLLQVPRDAQLRDSELHHPGPLVQAVEDVMPRDIEIRARAHPASGWTCSRAGRTRMLSGELAEAVDGARFVITINSNSANEALARGCPVLCLGPALYAEAGVARQARLVDLPRAVEEMLCGSHPRDANVANYLGWLACRQWTEQELAEGSVLKRLLDEAA